MPKLTPFLFPLALPLALAACGGDAPKETLSVTCNGSLMLAGTSTLTVDSKDGGAVLSFPDPANPDHTGSLTVAAGQPCTIKQISQKTGS